MSTLLVSLGSSPAIVPEAFLLPGAPFSEVHVITTASIPDAPLVFLRDWFREHAPQVLLTLTRAADFEEFKSEEDHFRFEEVLYRWMVEKTAGRASHVCLAGGFKTISAAVQKAAAVLGAAEVFHVLCDLPLSQQPRSADEIEAARAGGHLHWIRLGPESGWPQLRAARAEDYPLVRRREESGVDWVSAPDSAFRLRLREIVERSHRIAGAWDRLGDLPFVSLATWPASALEWLNQPLDGEKDAAWVASLPKTELHCHLGGFATHGEALGAVRDAARNPGYLPDAPAPCHPVGWPLPEHPVPLTDYMRLGDASGSALLKDAGCLRRQCELLYEHLVSENVLYAEIRCSPGNYATPGRSPWQVLEDIKLTFDRCMRARESQTKGPGQGEADPGESAGSRPVCHVNLILIATRKEAGDYRAAISRHLSLAVAAAEHWTTPDECRVVGVDLAGYEDATTRAHYFREEFTAIHRCGLALTVHAGENDDAEGIWRAVFDLNARRLGHALHLIDSPELMRSVAERGIGIEMCPFANLQIKGYPLDVRGNTRSSYPLLQYLRTGIRVTVNTDNIGISAASLSENLLLAARLCPGLTRLDLLRLISNAIDTAFLGPRERAVLRSSVERSLALPP